MTPNMIIALVLGLMTSHALGSPLEFKSTTCKPKDNCKPPYCRCWDDPHAPGNFDSDLTPQMILLSFDFSFNSAIVPKYLEILESLVNPNNCSAKATFFTQEYNSDPETLAHLYHEGHELSINSVNGIIPTSSKEWNFDIAMVKGFLNKAGIPPKDVKGIRSPQLFMGGNDQLDSMVHHDLVYDSSCVTFEHSQSKDLLWPYTLDFVDTIPKCSIGHTPNKAFPGLWEFPLPTLNYEGRHCPTPSACIPLVNTTDEAFRLFYGAFDDHYYTTRAPFILDIDPQWVTSEARVTGTKEFLQLVSAYPDTWVLTMSQALKWIQSPAPMMKDVEFIPWGCKHHN